MALAANFVCCGEPLCGDPLCGEPLCGEPLDYGTVLICDFFRFTIDYW